jgi:hypothetical protein
LDGLKTAMVLLNVFHGPSLAGNAVVARQRLRA